ncbi:MAG: polysaccharide deacetylase family protein [Rhodospirillaceae bacterium]
MGRIADTAEAVGEITACEAEVGALAEAPRLFRPFGGAGKIGPQLLNHAAREHLLAEGYTCVLWNSIPADWLKGGEWVERALEQTAAQAWSLVVLHDIPGGCVDDLERFLDALEARGDKIVQDFPFDSLPTVAGQLVRPDVLPELEL